MGQGGGSSRIHRWERHVGRILIWGAWVQVFSRSCVCLALFWIVCFFWVASRVGGNLARAGLKLPFGATAGDKVADWFSGAHPSLSSSKLSASLSEENSGC